MPIEFQEVDFRFASGKRPGLVIIDEVVGFCTVGAGNLAPRTHDQTIIDMVINTNLLANVFADFRWPIWAFRDEHLPDVPEPPYPPHCIKGTGEELLVPELRWLEKCDYARVAPKRCINGFVGAIKSEAILSEGKNDIIQWINSYKISHLVVVGICTDICVSDFVCTILSARNTRMLPDDLPMLPRLKEVIVFTPAISTYDFSLETTKKLKLSKTAAHPAEVTGYMGLYTMASRGAIIANGLSLGFKE